MLDTRLGTNRNRTEARDPRSAESLGTHYTDAGIGTHRMEAGDILRRDSGHAALRLGTKHAALSSEAGDAPRLGTRWSLRRARLGTSLSHSNQHHHIAITHCYSMDIIGIMAK